MFEFEKCQIWRRSIGLEKDSDSFDKEREKLRANYFDFRERVSHVVSQIPKDIPGLTVHDITHLDALWETANLIAGDDYDLNPAEAFVLGGAILLHDAGMCVASYPGGLKEIESTVEWQDEFSEVCRASGIHWKSGDPVESFPEELKSRARSNVLRALHAARAEKLAVQKWHDPNEKSDEYLIQNSELRSFYGPIIGRIAASHWWHVNELERLHKVVTAGPGIPSVWEVDPLKIACILRAADAAHVDFRRAPKFLRILEGPTGISADHWNFQAKLGKPSKNGDALIYSAPSGFEPDEAASWWLCFDAIAMIDGELRQIDALLQDLGKPRFQLNRVIGADHPSRLAELVSTSGWEPIDARVKVSNVPALAEMLGGEMLYGSNLLIALRELIQNAADSIRARRLYCDLPDDFGEITVELKKNGSDDWLEISDNGVGMSRRVLTEELLDFGKSLWTGGGVKTEFPGLVSKGMRATGRFGIGFFSVFMLGSVVQVRSRRFDAGIDKSYVLEFKNGMGLRPILRKPKQAEIQNEPGTRVLIKLDQKPDEGGLLTRRNWISQQEKHSLSEAIKYVAPALDVDVNCIEFGNKNIAIRNGDWKEISADEIIERINFRRKRNSFPETLSFITGEQGEIYGRATFSGNYKGGYWRECVITIGGLYASHKGEFTGVIVGGSPETVTREFALPKMPIFALQKWADDQVQIIGASSIDGHEKVRIAARILAAGGTLSETFPFATINNRPVNMNDIREFISAREEIIVCDADDTNYDEDQDEVRSSEFDDEFEVDDEVIVLPNKCNGLIGDWPGRIDEYRDIKTPKAPISLLRKLVEEVWGESDENYEDRVIGNTWSTEIERWVTVFDRLTGRD